MIKDMVSAVKDFMKSSQGRTKDIIHNLFTLIGYALCLPDDVITDMLPDESM